MAPRAVAKIGSGLSNIGYGMIANRGVALVVTDATTAVLYRLTDGKGWTIKAEPGETLVEPLWCDDDEVWIATSARKDRYESNILRLRRDTLGTPDVAPGL
jgi:hypothetical protein